jgi:transposase
MLAFIDPESRIPANHPLRTIKKFADAALAELSPQFDALYAAVGTGRASIPPERLLKASLLMSLFSVRSERAFCEALDYDLRFRWFLDMDLVEPSFDHSTFTRNRDRLLDAHVSRQFFDEVVMQADRLHLLSDEHFTVDGTLIEAAASLKSFRPKLELWLFLLSCAARYPRSTPCQSVIDGLYGLSDVALSQSTDIDRFGVE